MRRSKEEAKDQMRRSEFIALATFGAVGVAALVVGRYAAEGLEQIAYERTEAQLAVVGLDALEVRADGLVVALSGQVGDQTEHRAALAAVAESPMVNRVVDNLVIVAPLVDLRPAVLHVTKDATSLTLHGDAPNAAARIALEGRAQALQGDDEVFNLMKAQERPSAASWLQVAEGVLDAVATLRVGQATLETGAVRIVGAAPDAATRARVLENLSELVEPRYRLDADVTAPPPQLSPYVFSMRRTLEGLEIVACAAPDESTRSAILGAARATGLPVRNSGDERGCVVANGAPNDEWPRAVIRAIGAVSAIEEGEARIVDDIVSIEAYVSHEVDLRAAELQAQADWPDLYSVTANLSSILPTVAPYSFLAVKRPGVVRFSGHAPSARFLADWTEKLSAESEVQLARGAPRGWEEAAAAALIELDGLKLGAVTITDASIVISAPGDASERAQLALRVGAVAPDGYAVDVVEARAPRFLFGDAATPEATLDPAAYTFRARRSADGVTEVSGVVPDAAAKSVVLAFAAAKLGGDDLDGELIIGENPEPFGWRSALFAGLDALAALDQGDVRIDTNALYLSGMVADAADARRALTALERRSPPEYTPFTRIRVSERLAAPPEPVRTVSSELCVADLNALTAEQPIRFAVGSTDIADASRATIDRLAALMKRCPQARIEVGGHTDTSGSDSANLQLSRQRADAVRRALINRQIDGERLSAHGYGETRPIADNDTNEGRAKNRRIEFKLRE